ncbi:TPA: hypothetical protein ACH3X1_008538 [Trebouxia sp. C0004]
MQRWFLAGALLLAMSVSHAAAQTSEWTDFWGTIVNYQDGSAPTTNRRLHRHLLQSSSAAASATYSIFPAASSDWNNIANTLLSSNWSSLEPTTLQNFNWTQLGDFEQTTPIADLLQEIQAEGVPTTEDQVKADVNDIINAFCTSDSFKNSSKVLASCSGPTIILAMEPHECLLDDSTKQVTCKPAQLVLTKLAGSCQHKSESAVKFTGKSCKIQKKVGFSKNTVQGGANEIVPIDFSKLTMTDDD